MLVRSCTTRIVAAHRRARTTRELSLLLSLSRTLFLYGRAKDSRGFLRSYRLIRGSAKRVIEDEMDFPAMQFTLLIYLAYVHFFLSGNVACDRSDMISFVPGPRKEFYASDRLCRCSKNYNIGMD